MAEVEEVKQDAPPEEKQEEQQQEQKPPVEETKPPAEEKQEDDGRGRMNRAQRRIGQLIAERDAERQRREDLETRLRAVEERTAPKNEEAKPTLERYNGDVEKYAEALSSWTTNKVLAEKEAKETKEAEEAENREVFESYNERVKAAAEKYEDFEEVVGNRNIKIPQVVQLAVMEMENGPDVAYWLGKNPEEAAKLVEMRPLSAVRAIERIAAKLGTPEKKEEKKGSNAPPPIKPVAGSAKSDKKPEEMSWSEFRAWRDGEEKKRYGGRA